MGVIIRDRLNGKLGRVDLDGVVRDFRKDKRGEVDEDGTIRDRVGLKAGSIDADGNIRNRAGQRVGYIDGRKVRMPNNLLAGYVVAEETDDYDIRLAGAGALLLVLEKVYKETGKHRP